MHKITRRGVLASFATGTIIGSRVEAAESIKIGMPLGAG